MPVSVQKVLWVATAFIAAVTITGCGGGETKSEAGSQAASAAEVASDGTVEGPDGSTFTVTQGPDGQDVLAKFELDAGDPQSIMRKKAKLTTMDVLNAAKEKFPDAAKVRVWITVDGSVVTTLNYSKATLDKFDNFKKVSQDEIWQIADSGDIDPALAP
jgi:hypothetical protein